MAQTTAGISRGGAFQVQTSSDGSTWTHRASEAASVSTSGGEQMTGSQNTADGAAPIVKGNNKVGPSTVTVNFVYTKTSAQLFDAIRDAYESSDKSIYLRWAPEGGIDSVVGNDLFTCVGDAGSAVKCPIVSCLPPDLDAGSGDIAMASFSVLAPFVGRSATTTT